MMVVTIITVVGRGGLWLIHLKTNNGKLGKERPRKINKAVSNWDNGTGSCVGENGIPLEKNRLNMKVLAEKLDSPS